MVSNFFLALTLLGSEWVMWLLIVVSIFSAAIMMERFRYYRRATRGLPEFRETVRGLITGGRWADALEAAQGRRDARDSPLVDPETEIAATVLKDVLKSTDPHLRLEQLDQAATDATRRTRVEWERYLSYLATVGANAPFVGLFGTVLGIIKAFHDLAAEGGANAVSSGIAEALVATAIGLFVAIPAVIAFNSFQKTVKVTFSQSEALKSFILANL